MMLYCVYVGVGKESDVLERCIYHMDKETYKEAFVPMYEMKKRYLGEWHLITKVLFAGYIFFGTDDPDTLLAELKKVPRMTKMIKTGDNHQAVYPEEEKFLRTMMDKDYIVRMSEGLIIGDEVWITEGGLGEYRAKITSIDRHRRTAKVEIDLFGRPTPAEVGLEIVKKVTDDEFSEWKKLIVSRMDDSSSVKNISDSSNSKEIGRDKNSGIISEDVNSDGTGRDVNSKRKSVEQKPVENTGDGRIYGKVKKGLFSGMIGEIVSKTSRKTSLQLDLFGQMTVVNFDKNAVIELID